jgi:hypothetical protein
MAVFWIVAPCCLVEVYRLSRGVRYLLIRKIIALVKEAASTTETYVTFYQIILRSKQEGSHLQELQYSPTRITLEIKQKS